MDFMKKEKKFNKIEKVLFTVIIILSIVIIVFVSNHKEHFSTALYTVIAMIALIIAFKINTLLGEIIFILLQLAVIIWYYLKP